MSSDKQNIALLSVISNTILTIVKVITGLTIGSVSVISEGIHSGIDLLASIMAFWSVRTSDKPADKKHPFGHGKFENVSGSIEAIMVFIAALWIIYESIKRLIEPEPIVMPFIGIIVMLFSAAINFFVSSKLYKVAKEKDSIALKADGLHLKTDVLTSLGVAVSLSIIWLLTSLFPEKNLFWLDPAIAIIVAIFIIKEAFEITSESMKGLLDESINEELENKIIKIILSFKPEVYSFHNFKTRKSGSLYFIEFHLMVDANMTVKQAHIISDKIIDEIRKEIKESIVTIHVEPCEDIRCKEKCVKNCYLYKENLKHG